MDDKYLRISFPEGQEVSRISCLTSLKKLPTLLIIQPNSLQQAVHYFVSLCSVCFPQYLQNFLSSNRSVRGFEPISSE